MINKLHQTAKKLTFKTLIIFLISTSLLALLIITAFFGAAKIVSEASMDSDMGYTSEEFYNNLEIQDESGRKGYLLIHLADYIFITQFYVLLMISIFMLMRNTKISDKWFYLGLMPLVSGVFDLLENITIDISILIYPERILFLGRIAPVFTNIKFIVLYACFIIIVLLGFYKTIHLIKVKKK